MAIIYLRALNSIFLILQSESYKLRKSMLRLLEHFGKNKIIALINFLHVYKILLEVILKAYQLVKPRPPPINTHCLSIPHETWKDLNIDFILDYQNYSWTWLHLNNDNNKFHANYIIERIKHMHWTLSLQRLYAHTFCLDGMRKLGSKFYVLDLPTNLNIILIFNLLTIWYITERYSSTFLVYWLLCMWYSFKI